MQTILTAFHGFEELLLAFLISLPRMYAFITMTGIIGAAAVPRLARNAAILILSLPIIPANLAHIGVVGTDVPTFALHFAKEYAIGFILGYMIGWLFWSVNSAGDFIDNQRGAAIASSVDPLLGHETSPLGMLFSQAFLTYFYSIGGMLLVTGIVYKSYLLWPVTRMLPIVSAQFPVLILDVLDLAMRTMFVLAAPVVVMMFLAELALALVSRFAPQIQVFILAMPIKSGIGILVLVFYLSTMFPFASDQQSFFVEFVDSFYAILQSGANSPSSTGSPGAGTP